MLFFWSGYLFIWYSEIVVKCHNRELNSLPPTFRAGRTHVLELFASFLCNGMGWKVAADWLSYFVFFFLFTDDTSAKEVSRVRFCLILCVQLYALRNFTTFSRYLIDRSNHLDEHYTITALHWDAFSNLNIIRKIQVKSENVNKSISLCSAAQLCCLWRKALGCFHARQKLIKKTEDRCCSHMMQLAEKLS